MGAKAFAFGESNAPSTNAITGLSSTAPIVLPHCGQKAREDQSEDRHVAGAPPGPVHVTWSAGNSTQATVSAPECRWHILQEQLCGLSAGAMAAKRICPHRQPPSNILAILDTPILHEQYFTGVNEADPPSNVNSFSRKKPLSPLMLSNEPSR